MNTYYTRVCQYVFAIWLSMWSYPSIVSAQSNPASFPYQVSVQHFSVEQGLPNRTVLSIGQDKQGYIWLGTLDNAYRFDGKQFEPLLPVKNAQKVQAFDPAFSSIGADDDQNLWLAGTFVAGQRKLQILKPGSLQAQPVDEAFGRPIALGNDPILGHVLTTPTNKLHYLLTRSGHIWYLRKQGQLTRIGTYLNPGHTYDDVRCAYETQTGLLRLSLRSTTNPSGSLFLEIDSTGQKRRSLELPGWLGPFNDDKPGNIYFWHRVGHQQVLENPARLTAHRLDDLLYRLSPDGKLTPMPITFNRNPFPDPANYPLEDVRVQYDNRRDLFWVTGPRVVFAWHPQQGIVFDLSATNFPMASIPQVYRPYFDKTGAVWLITSNGVVVLTLEPNRFQRYMHIAEPTNTTPQYAIRGMVQHGSRLWVNTKESRWLDLKTGNSQLVLSANDPSWGVTANLCSISSGHNGVLWTAANHMLRVTVAPQTITQFPLESMNTSVSLWQDKSARLWIGYDHGLGLFDTRLNQQKRFTGYNQFLELAHNRVNGFFPDQRTGTIWVAASSGLYRLDTLRGIMARYSTKDPKQHYLPFDHITFVHPDPNKPGIYWLATRGGGLIQWNSRSGQYQQFTQKQGLSDNTLYAIYQDRYQRLWLPSNYGLMCFDCKTHQIQIYHTKDGIADEEFNLMAHYRAPDGRLFLGGLNGITAFYPDQIRTDNPVKAPLLVTNFQKLDTETGKLVNHFADFQQQNKIHLTSTDRLFNLSFALLDYRYIGQSRLWYRIQSWQEKWVVQEELDLRINGLPSGDYVIDVRAQTANGDWASSVLSVPITVDKPIYLRNWFLLLSLLLLVLGIQVIFRWRNRQLVQDKLRLEEEVARRTAQIEQDKAIIEQDKTIIEQQARDLQENATLKSRFFANVTHEFRTPLTLLLGPLQQLLKRVTDADAHQLLDTMERNTQQLLTLVNDLLDLSRLDASTLSISEKPADLVQVVDQVVQGFVHTARYEGISLQVSGVDQPIVMPLDKQKVETVLRNLLANAINYTSTGGSIRVNVLQQGNYASFEVSDTGSGIHADDLPYIFDRYFQSNQPDKPLRGGTGIGLALCHEYCTLWGGTLTATSQVGKGSCFTVSYPMRLVEPASLPAEPEAGSDQRFVAVEPEVVIATDQPSGSSNGKNILIVEDNRDMMQYLKIILSPLYTVQTATNGREALNLLEGLSQVELPQLIISDIMMPEVDGMELIQILKKNPLLRSIPIVMLTARVDLEIRLQALQFGIADYITKPFQEAELLARIDNLVRRADELANWQQQVGESKEDSKEPLPDALWIQLVQQKIQQNLLNTDLSVNTLAELMHMSERQIYRRCKAVTGLSPNQFIHEIRLQIAHDLLERNPNTLVKTIALEVGYKRLSYFIQLYRERFGISPGEQLSRLKETAII